MKNRFLMILSIIATLLGVALAAQSEQEFIDQTRNFKITLFGNWQPISYSDAVGRQKTDFIFHGNRQEGLLTIASQTLSGRSLTNNADIDLEDMKSSYATLFTSRETFGGGQLPGIRVTIYYVENGQKAVARHYYFQDGDVVWILRFTSTFDSRALVQDFTDRIARSFCTVCPPPPEDDNRTSSREVE
jgi:hypothetical protein